MTKTELKITGISHPRCIKTTADVLTTPKSVQSTKVKLRKVESLSLSFISGILIAFFSIVGCSDMPYTGSMMTTDTVDVNQYIVSPNDELVCLQNGPDSECLTLIPKNTQKADSIINGPIIHIHPERLVYVFYHEGKEIVRLEKVMDTTEIVETLTETKEDPPPPTDELTSGGTQQPPPQTDDQFGGSVGDAFDDNSNGDDPQPSDPPPQQPQDQDPPSGSTQQPITQQPPPPPPQTTNPSGGTATAGNNPNANNNPGGTQQPDPPPPPPPQTTNQPGGTATTDDDPDANNNPDDTQRQPRTLPPPPPPPPQQTNEPPGDTATANGDPADDNTPDNTRQPRTPPPPPPPPAPRHPTPNAIYSDYDSGWYLTIYYPDNYTGNKTETDYGFNISSSNGTIASKKVSNSSVQFHIKIGEGMLYVNVVWDTNQGNWDGNPPAQRYLIQARPGGTHRIMVKIK